MSESNEPNKHHNLVKSSSKGILISIQSISYRVWTPCTCEYVELMHLDMEIGRKIQEKTGNKTATSHTIQALSMTVQRKNTTSIMGTLGPQSFLT